MRATLQVGWEERAPLFEIRIWGIPLRRRGPPAFLRRTGERLLDRLLKAMPSPSEGGRRDTPSPIRRKPSIGLVWWALAALGGFLARSTRKLDLRLGGMDPALMGGLTGFLGGLSSVLGAERYSWIPDFRPGPFRFALRWTVSVSLVGILVWIGRSASVFPRKRSPAGLLPSAP